MKLLINFSVLIFIALLSGCITVKKEQDVSFIPQGKEKTIGYVNKDFLEVYTSTNNLKVETHLPRGTRILIIDSLGDFVNISNNPKYPSWVKAQYICFTEECWVEHTQKKLSVSRNENSKTKTTTQKTVNQTEIKKKKETPSIPSGATARCKDGTLSYSKSRRGTCSHHGGVSTWF
jgi:hypothetical protein